MLWQTCLLHRWDGGRLTAALCRRSVWHLAGRGVQPRMAAADYAHAHACLQSGPVAGLRSLGLDLVNASPLLKHTILRTAMLGLSGSTR